MLVSFPDTTGASRSGEGGEGAGENETVHAIAAGHLVEPIRLQIVVYFAYHYANFLSTQFMVMC